MSIPTLNVTARTTLGAMLVLSSAYFQAGSANLISAEGEKVQRLVASASGGSLGIHSLVASNGAVAGTVDLLHLLENQILTKIAAGIRIHNSPITW